MKAHSKTFLFFNFALAALIGIAAGVPLQLQADDTEIYLGSSSLSSGVRPNVLFILDTSGSMDDFDGGSIDRLDRMKNALYQILDEVNNINVGIMRFTDPGGPILFPVSYIDEDVSVIEAKGASTSGMDINVQISASNDDAEELKNDGSVDVVSETLELMETASGSSTTLLQRQVSSKTDDAEELSGGKVVTDKEIRHQDSQINGFRFQNITIPAGATILDARLIFTGKKTDGSSITLDIDGELSGDAAPFEESCGSCYDVSGRTKTDLLETVLWDPPKWSKDERGPDTTSPDLSVLVQEIIGLPGWASGNAMAFFVSSTTGGRRRARSYKNKPAKAAELEITYAVGATTSEQWVGLRFQDVGVPRGATITNAFLEFRAAFKTAMPADVKIHGDATISGGGDLDAAPFTPTTNNISNRTKSSANVVWSGMTAWDDPALNPTVYQSPDLTSIVQELVGNPDWCGNNAMGFLLEVDSNKGPRIAEAWDNDPSRAPVLRIDYDETTVPAGACIKQWVQRQVEFAEDDAEETITGGSVNPGGSQLDMDSSQINALRFRDIPIPQGAPILEANLTFTVRSTNSGASTLSFSNEAIDDAPAFVANNYDISNRAKGATVSWDPDDWDVVDEQHVTVDLTALVQDTVNRAGWTAGNSLAIIQEHTSGADRRAYTVNGLAAVAPILRIKLDGSLVTGGFGTNTVRKRLKEIIAGFDHNGYTPIVDTLYEAARYYRGDAPLYGGMRGHDRDGTYNPEPNDGGSNDNVRENSRMSHPASYTGGSVTYSGGCSSTNLNDPDCKDLVISGSPLYDSPITEACQASYIVALTDGYANHNHSAGLIKTMTGDATCIETDDDEACGRNLAKYLVSNDQSTGAGNPTGDQFVTTYTIGFNFSSDWLKNVALDGGGSFYTADSSQDLVNAFKAIIAEILSRTTSFATPSLSVNAFNKLFHRNDVYFSLFKPSGKARWDGNVKKYELCKSATLGCTLGEVLDANGDPAVNASNAIKDEALSFWSTGIDGAEIKVGGAANEIPASGSRRVYTFTGGALPADLSSSSHELTNANAAVTKTLLGDPVMSNGDRTDLINWIRGLDIDDEDGDTDTTENRFGFNDPLHSSPVAVTYGGTEADPVIKLFVGTNDGGVRMTNAFNGIEEWIWYPQKTLANQINLRPNPNGDHDYGIDGTPTMWVNDENFDGIIDPNYDGNGDGIKEFIKMFIGMRRGGDHYYALDVTPPTGTGAISNPALVDQVPPTYMWRIDGSSSNFPRLGESWSQPKLAKIALGTNIAGEAVSKTVLIFAGGYDDTQDSGFTTGVGELGNAIYIVDPTDGSRVFWVSGTDHGASDGVHVPGMDWPIPSDVSFMDSDGDGVSDRLFVGDVGGNVWRIDLRADFTTSAGIKATVGKLATVSDITDPLDQRKFFYKPDVIQAYEQAFSNIGRYDLVVINSGNRAHPLDLSVQDRFYAFRDYHVADLVDGDPLDPLDDDGLADGYTTLQGKTLALTGDLFDVTNVNDPQGANLAALQNADGYFLDFESNGEKGLASPVTLDGTAFFTTYLPEGVVTSTSCSLAEGSGLLYAINVLNGAAVYPEWDGDDTNLTKGDRTYTLGGGIPSSAVPIFQEEGITLLIGGGGGATTIDPNLALPRQRTYWGQEE